MFQRLKQFYFISDVVPG